VVGEGETAHFAQFWCNNFVHKNTGIPQIVRHRLSVLSEEPGAYSFLRNAPAKQLLEQAAFMLAVTTGLSQRLLDFVADGGDRVCVDHLADFLALSDHHEVQVYRRKRIPGDVDYS
jgi:hypothetical protein